MSHLFKILILLPSFFIFFVSCLEDDFPSNRPDLNINEVLGQEENENDSIDDPNTVEEKLSRPNKAIIIKADHCACSGGKSIGFGNCDNLCNQKSNTEEKFFFFNTEITAQFLEGGFEDIASFCSPKADEAQAVACEIQVKDESGAFLNPIEFVPQPGQTSFKVEIGDLPTNKTLRLSIIERISGSTSTTAQLNLTVRDTIDVIGGPLALMPVNEYTCMFRVGSFDQNTGELIIDKVNRFHFYFIPETRPEPLLATSLSSVNCHDLELSPTVPLNSPLLEETTGVFTVWNKSDPRFFDLDSDTVIKVNEIIRENIELQGVKVTTTPDLFFPLEFPSGFDDGDSVAGSDQSPSDANGSSIASILGFAMTPFIDDRTFKAFCPTRQHYYSSSPVFKAMRDIVGVDTEALYAAKQENVCDTVLIKESLLSKIWFFKEGGVHITPTPDTISGKQIQFYWPADISSPHIKKSHQRTYTVKSVTELNSACSGSSIDNTAQNSSGVKTNLPPHDKRLGCIPVLAD